MKSYLMTRKMNKKRISFGGIKIIKREGSLSDLTQFVDVIFEQGKITKTDCDMSAWVDSGYLKEVKTVVTPTPPKAEKKVEEKKEEKKTEAKAEEKEEEKKEEKKDTELSVSDKIDMGEEKERPKRKYTKRSKKSAE